MNYSVTVRPGSPHSGKCRPLPPGDNCPGLAHYAIFATSEPRGPTTVTSVCADHLFSTMGYLLDLPAHTTVPRVTAPLQPERTPATQHHTGELRQQRFGGLRAPAR